MKLALKNVAIRHVSAAVPANTAINDELEFDARTKRNIIKMTGVKQRRVLAHGMSLMDLYIPAARSCLESLDWSPDSIDGIIVVSQTHEYKSPATACLLHGALDLPKSAFAYDIAMGCSGYVMGLFNAQSHMAAASGTIKRFLLFVGDAISTLCHPRNKSTVFLFGDAGTCTALQYDEDAARTSYVIKTDGSGSNNIMVEHGGLKHAIDESSYLEIQDEDGNLNTKASVSMKGADIFNFTIREVPDLINETLQCAQLSIEDVNVFCMHQANTFMLQHLGNKVGVLDRTPINMEIFGNTSCASIPLLIADKHAECLRDNAMLLGFGVGLSMASCMVDLSKTTTELIEVK